jgi:hypothetical protein
MRKKTSQTCTLQNNINSRVTRSKMSDAATMAFEKRNGPCSWYWQTAASMLQKNCVTRVLCLHAMRLNHCAVQNSQLEITSEINLHEWTTSLQCSVLVTDWRNRNLGKLFKILIRKMYYMVEKYVSSWTICAFSAWNFLMQGHGKWTTCMLIIWENFGAFFYPDIFCRKLS